MSGDERRWRRLPRIRRGAAAEVDEEIRFHLETRVEDLVARGLSAAEARAQAEREFGDVAAARASLGALARSTERASRRAEWLSEVGQDLSYAWRMLRASPGFAVVAVLTLALGIGANVAIFSVVHAVLFRPLPYPGAERVVRIWETNPQGATHNSVSEGNYIEWLTRSRSLEAIGAYRHPYGVAYRAADGSEEVQAASITPSVMAVFGVAPLIGRGLTAEDDAGVGDVAVLSRAFWRDRFGGDPSVIGGRVVLDERPYTVVGVMPDAFDFPSPAAQVWLPEVRSRMDPEERLGHGWLVVGRLAEGVPVERAQAELDGIAALLARDYPQAMEGWGVNVVPFRADVVADVRGLLLLVLGAVGAVLLLACANIANLLLARAASREREMAVRAAIGAGRGRLIRQLLTESLLLAGLGGLLGFAVVAWLLDALVLIVPRDVPFVDDVRIDGGVLGFVGVVTVAATLLCGLVPALRMARPGLHDALRAGRSPAGGVRHARVRSVLLVAEIAVSVVLLAGAGLLVRSFARLQQVDLGLDPEGVLVVSLDVPPSRYGETAAQVLFYESVLERVAAAPGVASVAATTEPPAAGFQMTFGFAIENRVAGNASGREDPAQVSAVTPGFFRTMAIPVVSGRAFDARDRASAPGVAIINRALERRHWPDGAVGARIRLEDEWLEIVGVVGDARMLGAEAEAVPGIYVPLAQKPWDWMSWQWTVTRAREGVDPLSLAAVVREAVRSADASIPLRRTTTVEALYAGSIARRRFAATLVGGFAGLALGLGMIGIYGVLSYSVAQRRQEIGIRMALGQERGGVARDVVWQALRLALIGAALGLAGALALGRVLAGLLYDVSPGDPATLAAVTALLLAVAALAALVPAIRATRVDPAHVMRAG